MRADDKKSLVLMQGSEPDSERRAHEFNVLFYWFKRDAYRGKIIRILRTNPDISRNNRTDGIMFKIIKKNRVRSTAGGNQI
jgi:hypothetical protein